MPVTSLLPSAPSDDVIPCRQVVQAHMVACRGGGALRQDRRQAEVLRIPVRQERRLDVCVSHTAFSAATSLMMALMRAKLTRTMPDGA